MRGAVGFVVALVAGVGATSAYAVQPAAHTVDWYRTHQQNRDRVLATCPNNNSFNESGDCRNAQNASHAALADSLGFSGSTEPEANPAYYGRDGSMIALTLAACLHNQAPPSWCKAAKIASTNLHK